MIRLIALTLIAAASAFLSSPVSADPVTWTFYETSFQCSSPPCSGAFEPPTFPYPLVQLTLPGPTSSGSASWSPGRIVTPGQVPITTGDDFTLSINYLAGIVFSGTQFVTVLSPGKLMGQVSGITTTIEEYNISWTETSGQLDAVHIDYDGFAALPEAGQIGINLGLSGGLAGADGWFGGCLNQSDCFITGFWTDLPIGVPTELPIPEPGAFALLVTGILGTWLFAPLRSAVGAISQNPA